jgi:hypothetical protein
MDPERNDCERSDPGGQAHDGHTPEGSPAPTERSEPIMEDPTRPSVPTVLKRPRVLALIGALIVLVVVLIAACGGDDATSDAGGDDTTSVEIVDTGEDLAPVPEPAPEPVEPEATPEPAPVEPAELPITKVKGKALKRGMENKRVMTLQEGLICLGYLEEGTADGKFGGGTKKAVQAFQLDQGLEGDGVAGQKTIRAINRAVKATGCAPTAAADTTDDETADGAADDTGDDSN